MNLEGSDSAEASSPPDGGIGLHLLSIWDLCSGLDDQPLFLFFSCRSVRMCVCMHVLMFWFGIWRREGIFQICCSLNFFFFFCFSTVVSSLDTLQ